MSPTEVLEKLKLAASPKVQETLNAIFEVCTEQQKRGIDDFSVSTIAKLGFRRGVPKAQSLRNKSGEKYRALISSFADNTTKKHITKLSKTEESWVEEISNPKHKLLVNILLSELKATKNHLEEIIPPNTRIDIYDHKSNKPSEDSKLTTQERRALEYIISSSFQKKWGLKPNKYGELIDGSNQPIFMIATIDAIKKALDNL